MHKYIHIYKHIVGALDQQTHQGHAYISYAGGSEEENEWVCIGGGRIRAPQDSDEPAVSILRNLIYT